MRPVFSKKKSTSLNQMDINNIRDAAITVSDLNIQLAHDLMLIAHKARPDGPFIKKKLDEYKILLDRQKNI